MTTDIRGSKGGGATHTPTESPDNLRSIAYFRILDLVSEGEIGGLVNGQQSIYLDETPMANPDGSLNFPKAHIEQRTGTPDQTVIPGFDSTENEIGISVELKAVTPWVRSITNPALDAVRVTLGVPALSKANTTNGDITGYTISYKIELQTDGGAYQQVYTGSFTGKTTTKFQRSHRIDLPTATTGWQVRVTRLTANANSSAIQDTTTIDSYTEIVDSALAYPDSALMGVMGDASQFTNIPQRAYDLWGRIIQVPSNYDVTDRSYTGVWDGTFKPSWSDNPAWVFYDLCTNTRYGLGHLVSAAQVDKWELYRIGQYCDGMVDDGQGGTEPRFACNVFLQTQADAYKLLNDLSSAFRGISYWANGTIVASADMPGDPVYPYTNANVIDGKFSYSASARKTRYTSALVSWNDPRNFYRTKIEYVEDADGIARYGFQQATATAFGCTSQGQAQRFGKWLLLTSRLETDTVTFSVGLEGTVAAPGQIITVADAARAGKRQGGRVHSATTTAVTVDAAPTVAVGDTLIVVMPDGVSQTRTVSAVSGKVITVSSAFTSAPLAQSVWTVESTTLAAQTYRVLAVTENKSDENISFTITALQHNASKFSAVDEGTAIVVPPISVLKTGVQSSPLSVTLSAHAVVGQVATYSVLTISWEQAPGAIRYEVEWRRDNGEWKPVGNPYGLSVDVVGVSAGTYTARVRAIARDGNASLPRQSDAFVVGDASTLPTSLADISGQADDAKAAADAANAALAAIASDNVLSAGEKPVVIRDYNVIMTEQAGIDAQASAYGITTEKTAYDGKVSALTSYLATLTTPKLWSDLTGDTTIVGSTFRQAFADVYTTRQALLNAIYAAAKAKADAAQSTANTAVGQVQQEAVINGGFDVPPTGYGWTADAGTGWFTDTTGVTPGVGPNGGRHTGGVGSATGAYRNSGKVSCTVGQVYKVQALIKASGANGTCAVYISWLNAAGGEIGTTFGNQITGTTIAGSSVVGTAPAGTFYAQTCLAVNGHTTGYYVCDNVVCTQYPSSQDEVPDGTTYVRSIVSSTSETVDNAGFELPFDSNGNVPGWGITGTGPITLSFGTTAPYQGLQSLKITGGTGADHFGVLSQRTYPCNVGDTLRAAAACYTQTGVFGVLQVRWYDGTGTQIGENFVQGTAFNVWQPLAVNSTAPAGAVCARIALYNPNTNGGIVNFDAVTMSRLRSIDTEVSDGTTYGRTSQSDLYVSGGVNRVGLRIAGSGQRVGDQRNLVTRTIGNIPARVPSVISYSAPSGSTSPVTVTFSVAAFSMQAGSYTVSYGAMSASMSVTRGTAYTVFLYFNDPTQAGGTPTLIATTNAGDVYGGDGFIYVGSVAFTIPTSGGGSGSGGGGGGSGCVDCGQYMPHGQRAWEVMPGDAIIGTDGGLASQPFTVQRAGITDQPCWRLITESGASVTASDSTPMTLPDGSLRMFPDMLGELAAVRVGDVSRWERVKQMHFVGARPVNQISIGGNCYWAGDVDGTYIATHNNSGPLPK